MRTRAFMSSRLMSIGHEDPNLFVLRVLALAHGLGRHRVLDRAVARGVNRPATRECERGSWDHGSCRVRHGFGSRSTSSSGMQAVTIESGGSFAMAWSRASDFDF